MKILLPVLLALLPVLVNGQVLDNPKLTRIDSLSKQQSVLTKRIDNLTSSLQRISKTNDSLNKELYYYRAKDDFYVMAVDRQGSHFEWFVGMFITLAGLGSYAFFKRHLKEIKNEFSHQLSSFEEDAEEFKRYIRRTSFRFYIDMSVVIEQVTLRFVRGETNESNLKSIIYSHSKRYHYIHDAFLISDESNRDDVIDRVHRVTRGVNTVLDRIEEFLKDSSEEYKVTFLGNIESTVKEIKTVLVEYINNDSDAFSDEIILQARLYKLYRDNI